MYELVIILVLTWAGPGSVRTVDFETKDGCFEALAAMRIEGLVREGGEDSKEVVAYCQPLQKK